MPAHGREQEDRALPEERRPATSLRYETFANSGRHAPERFWVRVPSHGVEIVVPENKTMLDALNEAGVEVMGLPQRRVWSVRGGHRRGGRRD